MKTLTTLATTLFATSALSVSATTFEYLDDDMRVRAGTPPHGLPYSVLDESGTEIGFVHADPLPMSHWRPFWAPVEVFHPFGTPEVEAKPVVTVEEVDVARADPEDRKSR